MASHTSVPPSQEGIAGVCGGGRCPSQPVSRVLSGGAWNAPPGRPSLWDGCCQPPQAAYPGFKRCEPHLIPAWPCSGWGLPGRPRRRERRCALTAPFHPRSLGEAELRPDCNLPLCCTVPSGHPAWLLASTLLCGARTFLSPDTPGRDRPANLDAPSAADPRIGEPNPLYLLGPTLTCARSAEWREAVECPFRIEHHDARAAFADQAGRVPSHNGIGGHIAGHDRSCRHNSPLAHCHPLEDDGP